MSVAFTEQAVRERRKTVTRRKGWLFLKPGDRLTLCRKVMGRKKGEPLVRICEVEVINVWREPLGLLSGHCDPGAFGCTDDYPEREVEREGFPGMRPSLFVSRFFVDAQGILPTDLVTRIEWRYLDGDDR
jgi:hypothetical protein